jgi:hypothetical protein
MDANDVAAIIVTRGDCDLQPIRDSLIFGEVLVWDNSLGDDQGAYGRSKAIRRTWRPVIYVQDDDCLVSQEDQQKLLDSYEPGILSALMPASRNDYFDTVLVGWGALFDWRLPQLAFSRWRERHETESREFKVVGADFVFPMLTPWRRIDAEHIDLPHAHAKNRTWASWPDYELVKQTYLSAAREIRERG